MRGDVLDERLRPGRRAPPRRRGRRDGHLRGDRAGLAADGAARRARAPSTSCRRRRRSGRGALFRAYESRLAERDVHAAQVLLTSYDLSVRMHYLNARQALRRLLEWRAVPVVNENDTTATDEITFGDNDFLSAQLALLLGARLLVLLTDTDGLYTADPRRDARGRARARRSTSSPSSTATRSATGPRCSAPAACAARSPPPGWRAPPGSRRVICDGTAAGSLLAAARGGRRRHQLRAARGANAFVQALAAPREAALAAGSSSTPARRGCCARAGPACCRSGSSRRGRVRGRRRGRGRL